MKKSPSRQSLLARVHVLAKSLSLDESRYRTILLCFTGQQSCRVLGAEKLQHLIAVLETMEHGNDPDNTPPRHRYGPFSMENTPASMPSAPVLP